MDGLAEILQIRRPREGGGDDLGVSLPIPTTEDLGWFQPSALLTPSPLDSTP